MISHPDRTMRPMKHVGRPLAPSRGASPDPGALVFALACLALAMPALAGLGVPESLHGTTLQADDDFMTRRAHAARALAEDHLAVAIDLACELAAERPDDLESLGILADTQITLGQLEDAEHTVQWMLDMRPTSLEALLRTARFRAAVGDADGAVESVRELLPRLPLDPALAAATLVDCSTLLRRIGREVDADSLLARATSLDPTHAP